MRAIILAAGYGSRLMPLTQNVPKCMVKYKNKCIIDYEIEALKAAEIADIAVVGGYLYDVLEHYVKKQHDIKYFYHNVHYDKSNMVSTLFCARDFMQECIANGEDIIISYADIVYFHDTIKMLIESKNALSIVIDKDWLTLWNKRFDNPLSDAETLKIHNGYITELGKKPTSYADIQGQYIGLFKISHTFLHTFLAFYDALDRSRFYDGKDFDNMYMTSFLQALIESGTMARAVEIHGRWCEIDMQSDLEIDI